MGQRLLPRMNETFEVKGLGDRIWICKTPPAEAWVMAGYTLGLIHRGAVVGRAVARLLNEPPERRKEIVREILTEVAPENIDAQVEVAHERLLARLDVWAKLLPHVVVGIRFGATQNAVTIVQTPEEEGEDPNGTERVCVHNAALLNDWEAIHAGVNEHFGRGAELGERFRPGEGGEPAPRGQDGTQVPPAAE